VADEEVVAQKPTHVREPVRPGDGASSAARVSGDGGQRRRFSLRRVKTRSRSFGGGFRIGGRISTLDTVVTGILAFAVLLGLWWLAAANKWVDPLFLPAPSEVWQSFRESISNGHLWTDTKISVGRIMIAFAIASAMAIPIGVLIAGFRRPEAAIEPIVNFARYLPVTALVPLTIVWSGTSETQKWLIIWIGTFFQQVLIIKDDVKRTPVELIDIGRTLGMSEIAILSRIVVPNALPRIWDTLRITLGWAWTWVVLAELVGADSGLGYRTTVGQRYFETDLIIAYILVIGVLGLVTDQGMKVIGKRLFGWAEARR
jgi:NitT/TauT family transport system permease protein